MESTKRRERRSYTDEFKAQAVKRVLDEGKPLTQVARDLDLTRSALEAWVRRAKADRGQGRPQDVTSSEREELARLRKENRELQMERDFLKNSSGARRPPPVAAETPGRLPSRAAG